MWLSGHLWWHLCLPLIDAGETDRVLEIYDRHVSDCDPDMVTRLNDGASLLWRLELAGVDVGHRWEPLAAKWMAHLEGHVRVVAGGVDQGREDRRAGVAGDRVGDVVAADAERAVVGRQVVAGRGVVAGVALAAASRQHRRDVVLPGGQVLGVAGTLAGAARDEPHHADGEDERTHTVTARARW